MDARVWLSSQGFFASGGGGRLLDVRDVTTLARRTVAELELLIGPQTPDAGEKAEAIYAALRRDPQVARRLQRALRDEGSDNTTKLDDDSELEVSTIELFEDDVASREEFSAALLALIEEFSGFDVSDEEIETRLILSGGSLRSARRRLIQHVADTSSAKSQSATDTAVAGKQVVSAGWTQRLASAAVGKKKSGGKLQLAGELSPEQQSLVAKMRAAEEFDELDLLTVESLAKLLAGPNRYLRQANARVLPAATTLFPSSSGATEFTTTATERLVGIRDADLLTGLPLVEAVAKPGVWPVCLALCSLPFSHGQFLSSCDSMAFGFVRPCLIVGSLVLLWTDSSLAVPIPVSMFCQEHALRLLRPPFLVPEGFVDCVLTKSKYWNTDLVYSRTQNNEWKYCEDLLRHASERSVALTVPLKSELAALDAFFKKVVALRSSPDGRHTLSVGKSLTVATHNDVRLALPLSASGTSEKFELDLIDCAFSVRQDALRLANE